MDVTMIGVSSPADFSGQAPQRDAAPKPQTASQAPGDQTPPQQPSQQELDAAIAALTAHYGFKFEVSHDPRTGIDIVRVFSDDGQQLLRQTPPQGIVNMAEDLQRGGKGGLLGALV